MVTAMLFCVIFSFPFSSDPLVCNYLTFKRDRRGREEPSYLFPALYFRVFWNTISYNTPQVKLCKALTICFAQSHRLAVLAMPPSGGTGTFSSPCRGWLTTVGKKDLFPPAEAGAATTSAAAQPLQQGMRDPLDTGPEAPSTALSHHSSRPEQASTAPKLHNGNFHV